MERLAVGTRTDIQADLNGSSEAAANAIVVGNTGVTVNIDTVDDTLTTLGELQDATADAQRTGILEPDQKKELDDLFEKIRIKFPKERKIIETLERLKVSASSTPPAKKEGGEGKEKGGKKKKAETEVGGEKFEVGPGDARIANNTLQKLLKKLEESKLDDSIETKVLRFLQEIEALYENNDKLAKTITKIQEAVKQREKTVAEEKQEEEGGGEAAQEASKEEAARLAVIAAVEKEPFLANIFMQPDHQKTLAELEKAGYDIAKKGDLRRLVAQFLEKQKDHREALGRGYKTGDALFPISLSQHQITPDQIPQFSRELQEYLPKKTTASKSKPAQPSAPPVRPVTPPAAPPAPPAKPPTPPATTPAAPAAPKTVEPPVKAEPSKSTASPVSTPAGAPAAPPKAKSAEGKKTETAKEDLAKLVDEIFEKIKLDPNFRTLRRIMRLLRTSSKHLSDTSRENRAKVLRSIFGTDDLSLIHEKINSEGGDLAAFVEQKDPDLFRENELINGKTLLRFLLEKSAEKTPEAMLKAIENLVTRLQAIRVEEAATTPPPSDKKAKTEAAVEDKDKAEIDALREKHKGNDKTLELLNKVYQHLGIEGAKYFDEQLSKKAAKAAPPEAKAPEAKATPPEVAREAVKVPDSLAEAIELTAKDDESRKQRLIELWQVARGEKRIKEKETAETIRKLMENANYLAKKPGTMELAVNNLNRVLQLTENMEISDVEAEEVDFNRLRQLVNTLTEGQKELEKLKKLLDDIFEILEIDPADYPEAEDWLEGVKKDLNDLLLTEIPGKMIKEIPKCNSIVELLEHLKALGARGQMRAMKQISAGLTKDAELAELIERVKQITRKKEPESTPPTPPPAPTGGGAAAPAGPSAAGPSATPPGAAPAAAPAAPTGTPPAVPSAVSTAGVNAYPNNADRINAVHGFLSRFGYSEKSKEPAVVAIINLLYLQIQDPDNLASLETYLRTATFDDELEKKYKPKTLKDLETQLRTVESRSKSVAAQVNAAILYQRKVMGKPEEEEANEKLNKLHQEEVMLSFERQELNEIIKRRKEGKGKETKHYRNPEQLLGMMNMYFAQKEVGENQTPDYAKVLESTHQQLEAARQAETGRWNWVVNRLLPHNYFKPRLTSTLKAVCEKDPALKKVKPEYAEELAKAWDDPAGVEAWIHGLEGSEKDNMEKVIPALIAHLSIACNTGHVANINSISLNRAKNLLHILRQAVHEYAKRHAESQSGSSLDKLNSYFSEMNDIHRKAISREDIVTRNSRIQMLKNMGITLGTVATVGGIGAGAIAIAGLSAPLIVGTMGAGAAAATKYSSYRVKDPETKKTLSRASARVLVTSALGGLALAATPWLLPVAATGLFAPEIWKNRAPIGKAIVKGAPPVAKYGIGVPLYGALRGVGWGAGFLLSGGLGWIAWPRWRKVFGMHFHSYLEKSKP